MNPRLSLVGGVLFVAAASVGAATTIRAAPERSMDRLRQRLTECALPGLRCAPAGTFLHQRSIGPPPDAAFGATDPGVLVSSAWIDMRRGPYRLELPGFGHRYFAVQIRDGRDDLVGLANARVAGIAGGTIRIEGAGNPPAPGAIRVTTPYAWIVASIAVDGDADAAAVALLQDALRLSRP